MKGFVSVIIYCYLTNKNNVVSNKQKVYGFSKIQQLNTVSQKENAYQNALNHAGSKYIYENKYKSDIEYHYYVVSSKYNPVHLSKGNYYRDKVIKTDIKPQRKRELHKQQVIYKNTLLEKRKLKVESERMTTKRQIDKDLGVKNKKVNLNKMTKKELIAYIKARGG